MPLKGKRVTLCCVGEPNADWRKDWTTRRSRARSQSWFRRAHKINSKAGLQHCIYVDFTSICDPNLAKQIHSIAIGLSHLSLSSRRPRTQCLSVYAQAALPCCRAWRPCPGPSMWTELSSQIQLLNPQRPLLPLRSVLHDRMGVGF